MNDRILGYTVIGLVVTFLVLPIAYLIWQSSEPVSRRTIAFNNVEALSFLSIQDPVRLDGVEIGVVKNIVVRDTTAYVQIEIDTTVNLYENYSIFVIAKGLLGGHYLTIQPGDPAMPEIPESTLLSGRVGIRPDEAIAHIGQLREAVHTLAVISEQLKNGTTQQQSLVSKVWQITTGIDSLFQSLIAIMSELDTTFQMNIDSTAHQLEKVLSITRDIGESVPETVSSLKKTITSMDSLLADIHNLYMKADSVVTAMNNPDLPLWKEHTGSVHSKLEKLRTLLVELQKGDSLELPIRLW